MEDKISLIISLIMLVLISVSAGYAASDKIDTFRRGSTYNEVQTPSECSNLTLEETAFCLNKYVRTIHKYKSRPDTENPTLEELKEEGGDCLNWANLYVDYIEQLGFNGKIVRVNLDKKYDHAFATISNQEGYCVLDQKEIFCTKLKNSSLDNETKSI